AAQRPDRNVLVCFLGSHYAGQDGARVLYWVVDKGIRGSKDSDQLAERVVAMREQAEVQQRRIGLLGQPDLLTGGGDDRFWIRERLRRMLTGKVNALNYEFRHLNLDRKAAQDRKDEAAAKALEPRIAERRAEIARFNEMRRQLHERTITDPDTFAVLTGELRAELEALRAWLQADEQRMAAARRLEEALAGRPVIAHAGIDFADASRAWMANPFGLDCMTVLEWNAPKPGHLVKHMDAWQQAWNRVAPAHPAAAPMRSPDLAATTFSYEFLSYPRRRQVASIIPVGMGLMGAQLTTMGDALDRDEMPTSEPAPDLQPLAVPVSAWLRDLLASDLPLKTGVPQLTRFNDKLVWRWNGSSWGGLRVDMLSPGSEEVDGPAAGAVIFVSRPHDMSPSATGAGLVAGRSNSPMARVNPAGHVFAPHVVDDWTTNKISGIAFGADGAPQSYHDGATASGAQAFNIRLFSGFGNGVYVPFQPAEYSVPGFYQRLVGRTDSTVKRTFGGYGSGGLVVVSNEERALKLIGSGLFLLGGGDDRPQGRGISPSPESLVSLDVLRRSAEDTAALNRQRLHVLREKNLVNRPIERVHAECIDNLDDARAARAAGDVRLAAAHETIAAALAYRAHTPLRENANDLLKAVVFLLILSIPFAFAVERLVLGSVSIYRQILGFSGIFVGTFLILYFTHPAFALADAPIIIFLAFIIILLSGFVISVVMGKFKHELMAMQGLSQRSHSAGNGNSTTFAAVIIGIAGMRNRPLKTFLTTITVTLLTFTILVFASFQSGSAVVESYLGRSRGADRIEVHQPSFLRIPDRVADAIERIHGERFDVVRRTASCRDPLGGTDYEKWIANVVLDPVGGGSVKIDALLGLDQREAARLPQGVIGDLAEPAAGAPQPLWLSATVAKRLGLSPGAEVRIRGMAFRLAGTFDEERLKNVENIDGTKLMPPDFDATLAATGNQGNNATNFNNAFQTIDTSSFIFTSPTLTAITTNRAVRELGGMTNVLVLYPKGEADLKRTANDIAGFFNGPVYASSGDGAKQYFYTREVTGGGLGDLIVPLLLGGLIIFSSLLGSIVDRQKEIFTYSALGLSPRDVGTLFFAESSVIAVVGGLGGYLLGQLAAKILNLLGDHGLMNVPDMNFSSLSSLMTIFAVMAMVLLSTIYPALMASRSANPGVNRAWRMPKPDGDKLVFTFPFTVPEKSFGGIVAFIREHFGNHSDAALDVFAAKRVGLYRVDGHRVGIRSEVALAPFDLGVYQRFAMHTRPSDIPGIDEVVVEIERLNGHHSTWLRGNKAFIKDLREQFLIWRSLPNEAVEHYQAEAARVLAEATDGGAHGQA
ncbi:MAG: FtsX-like permease family protein, partial [Planctomycetes bacterium]|nr:FtsX-like permease family protein [Planctomycetota bacterium]